MARAFLLSHGTRVGEYADTFVPEGKSISFYANFDENTLRVNGLAALNNGDIAPVETLVGPCGVANYQHDRFEDQAIAEHLASESSATGGPTYYVGSDLPDPSYLCTQPQVCATTYPRHHSGCAGIFVSIAEGEIYSVACRGLSGGSGGSTPELGGDREFDIANEIEVQRILDWGATDPDAAMQYWQSLTQATQVSLIGSDTRIRAFTEQYFATHDGESAAVSDGRQYLEAYGEETFYQWIETLPADGRQRMMMLADPALATAYRSGSEIATERTRVDTAQQEWEATADTTWVPTAEDLAGAAEINGSTVKAAGDGDELDYEVAGFVMLIGAGHPAGWYTWAAGEADHATGRLRVAKGGVFSRGGFEVESCPPAKQGVVESALGAFSDKSVEFV